MERTEIFAKLAQLLEEQTGISTEGLDEGVSFSDDLKLDSLDLLELITSVEETFDVLIPDEDFEIIHTAGDVVDELVKLGA